MSIRYIPIQDDLDFIDPSIQFEENDTLVQNFCKRCNKALESGWTFCPYCGEKANDFSGRDDSTQKSTPAQSYSLTAEGLYDAFLSEFPELEQKYDLNDWREEIYHYVELNLIYDRFLLVSVSEGNYNYHGTDRKINIYEFPVTIEDCCRKLEKRHPETALILAEYATKRERALSAFRRIAEPYIKTFTLEQVLYFSENTTVLEASNSQGDYVAVKLTKCSRKEWSALSKLYFQLDRSRPNLLYPSELQFITSPDGTASCALELYPLMAPLRGFRNERLIHNGDKLTLAIDLARGLAEIHKLGYAHLDIKPENCYLNRAKGQYLLGDFSSARRADSHFPANLCVTSGFAAPEILNYHEFSPASDIYSFGKTVAALIKDIEVPGAIKISGHELLVFCDDSAISEFVYGKDLSFWRIIIKCVAEDPFYRYPDAEHLLRDLEQLR